MRLMGVEVVDDNLSLFSYGTKVQVSIRASVARTEGAAGSRVEIALVREVDGVESKEPLAVHHLAALRELAAIAHLLREPDVKGSSVPQESPAPG